MKHPAKRTEFDYTVPAKVMGDKIARKVWAQSTATPGLIVHEKVDRAGIHPRIWDVVHEATGLTASAGYGMGIRKARLLAGAMGGLPVDWTLRSEAELAEQWKLLDSEWRAWMKSAGHD